MYIYTVLFIIATVFFLYNPHYDVIFSQSFFDEVSFSFYQGGIYDFLKEIPFIVMYIMALTAIVYAVAKYKKTKSFHPKHYKFPILIAIVWILLPNVLFRFTMKPSIGRPRPNMIEEFGGELKYSPPFYAGEVNSPKASFVSTHTALTCLLFVFAVLTTGWRHYALTAFTASLALLVGYGRISTGQHFLSDVVYAILFMYLGCYILQKIIYNVSFLKDSSKTTSELA